MKRNVCHRNIWLAYSSKQYVSRALIEISYFTSEDEYICTRGRGLIPDRDDVRTCFFLYFQNTFWPFRQPAVCN